MSSIVIDSNVLIDVMNGCGDYAATLGKADEVLVPLIVLGELHAGFSDSKADHAKRRAVERFLEIPSVRTVTLTEETVGFYASGRRQLKRAGRRFRRMTFGLRHRRWNTAQRSAPATPISKPWPICGSCRRARDLTPTSFRILHSALTSRPFSPMLFT